MATEKSSSQPTQPKLKSAEPLEKPVDRSGQKIHEAALLAEQKMASLGKVEKIGDEDVLPLHQQLAIILKFRDLYLDAPSDKKPAIWQAYLDCIDTFRKAAFDLPPGKDAPAFYKNLIGPAMVRQDSAALMKIFAQEKANINESWEEVKDTPVLNFAAGAVVGAGELAKAAGQAWLTAEIAYGDNSSVTAKQREQAQKVMAEMGKSLVHLSDLAKGAARTQEYENAMEHGHGRVGYIMGKHAFDLALLVLTAGGGGALAKGATLAERAAVATGETLSRAAEAIPVASLKKAATAVALEVAENVLEEGITQSAKKQARGGI